MSKIVFVHNEYNKVEYWKCRHCVFISTNRGEIEEHLIQSHIDDLPWQEIK